MKIKINGSIQEVKYLQIKKVTKFYLCNEEGKKLYEVRNRGIGECVINAVLDASEIININEICNNLNDFEGYEVFGGLGYGREAG